MGLGVRGEMFVYSAVLCLLVAGTSFGQDDPFSLEDILTGRYGQRSYGGVWISNEELQYKDGSGNVAVQNVVTNISTVVVPASVLTQFSADSYSISPDRQFVLISYDTMAQFRHSTTARFIAVSLVDGKNHSIENGAMLQHAHWGPTLSSILYVLDNDIYYVTDISRFDTGKRLTVTGKPGVIYNGVPDWVYEEEVLGTGTAYWFSPEGRWLIYLEFNDTAVPEMTYSLYGKPGTLEDQYPKEVTIRYPKAGAINPDYKAYLVDLTRSSKPTLISSKQNDGITYGFTWANEEKYAELSMSRVQNESSFEITDMSDNTRKSYTYENRNGWILSTTYKFDSTGRYLLSIESQNVDDFGGFSHLVFRDTEGSNQERILTYGKFVVLSILAWDERRNIIYYTANEVDKPYTTQVYGVDLALGVSTCISCTIATPEGNNCTSASASFSPDFTYILLTCSAPDPTVVALYQNDKVLQKPLIILQDNEALRTSLKTKALPTFLDATADVDLGLKAQVRLQLPKNFDVTKKYPLLVNVYAGPDSNQIIDGFSVNWGTYLTSSLGVIYAFIDGRGSGRRGDDLIFAGYRSLGTVEIQDQINVTRQLQLAFPWIDSSRSAIWGWSYGGYATGKVLELDTAGVFKCGISVAPVTSWLYYDSVYTERYMGLPTEEDNLDGYLKGDLVSNVENLKKKKYYLIHGNGDDNVHYQQSMLLSRALELDDVLFQQQSYPDENHSLGGVSRHLYHSMDKFWKECFAIA